MTYLQLYQQDKAAFMEALLDVKWAVVAALMDKGSAHAILDHLIDELGPVAEEMEANTDDELPGQAADDVINQSRRGDVEAYRRGGK